MILYLMTEKGLGVLKRIAPRFSASIYYVVVGTDSALEYDYSEEIRDICKSYNLAYFSKQNAPPLDPDMYVMCVSWRWLIQHPSERLIIFHDSLLPKYRGFAPLVNMLINGEEQIGATAIFGAKDYDVGPIIAQTSRSITYPIKINHAISLITDCFGELAEEIFFMLQSSQGLTCADQDEEFATYSIWLDDDDYWIDWSKSAKEILRFIDAVGFPYRGARSLMNGKIVTCISSAEYFGHVELERVHHGKVLMLDDGKPVVITGCGLIKITEFYEVKNDNAKIPLEMLKFRTRFS